MTSVTAQIINAHRITEIIKRVSPASKVVVGGVHAAAMDPVSRRRRKSLRIQPSLTPNAEPFVPGFPPGRRKPPPPAPAGPSNTASCLSSPAILAREFIDKNGSQKRESL
jgi:hypothetical protein